MDLPPTTVADVDVALESVAAGRCDVAVYNAPVLVWASGSTPTMRGRSRWWAPVRP